jgi:hypothetical protein
MNAGVLWTHHMQARVQPSEASGTFFLRLPLQVVGGRRGRGVVSRSPPTATPQRRRQEAEGSVAMPPRLPCSLSLAAPALALPREAAVRVWQALLPLEMGERAI